MAGPGSYGPIIGLPYNHDAITRRQPEPDALNNTAASIETLKQLLNSLTQQVNHAAAHETSHRYGQSRQPTFVTSQWDLLKVLDIDPNAGSTCIGYAPSKRRGCFNPVACQNRAHGIIILQQASRLDPEDPRLGHELYKAASLLLCVRNHQNQADSIVDKWLDKLDCVTLEPSNTSTKMSHDDFEPVLLTPQKNSASHIVQHGLITPPSSQRRSLPAAESLQMVDEKKSCTVLVTAEVQAEDCDDAESKMVDHGDKVATTKSMDEDDDDGKKNSAPISNGDRQAANRAGLEAAFITKPENNSGLSKDASGSADSSAGISTESDPFIASSIESNSQTEPFQIRQPTEFALQMKSIVTHSEESSRQSQDESLVERVSIQQKCVTRDARPSIIVEDVDARVSAQMPLLSRLSQDADSIDATQDLVKAESSKQPHPRCDQMQYLEKAPARQETRPVAMSDGMSLSLKQEVQQQKSLKMVAALCYGYLKWCLCER